MSKFDILEVVERNTTSQAQLNTLRKNGLVPGVIYGGKQEPTNISVNEIALSKLILKRGMFSKAYEIKFADEKYSVVIKDIQFHPVTGRPVHMDFMRVQSGKMVNLKVPIAYKNETLSPAIKKGGVLSIVVREIDLLCKVASIPEAIVVDLSGIDFHHTIKISDLKIPNDAKVTSKLPSNATVVTVVAPSGLRSEINKEATAAVATPETAKAGEPAVNS